MSKQLLKSEAILLRQKGYSYELIKQSIGVSKSTLCDWLRNIPFKPNSTTLERMNRGRIKSIVTLKRLRLERIKFARDTSKLELGKITKRDLMMVGIGLYIGEGGKYDKGCIQFSNSDPRVIKLAMNWFTIALRIPIIKFRGIIHIYPDIDTKTALNYWSKLTKIPKNQFNKTYVDLRTNKSIKNKRKLLFGTLHIRIKALDNKDF